MSLRSLVFLPIVAVAAFPAAVRASGPSEDDEIGYAINGVGGAIIRLDFDAADSTVVNTDAAARKSLDAIAVRDDVRAQHLIVADRGSREVLFYAGAQGNGLRITNRIAFPSGVSIDARGNVYVVTRPPRKALTTLVGLRRGEVWEIPRGGPLPGDYATPVPIDRRVPSAQLVETRISPSRLGPVSPGDLLVLSQDPPAIFHYRRKAGGGFRPRRLLVAPGAFPRGVDPSGFALAPRGELVVATRQGRILRFAPNGALLQPDFASGPGALGRIAIGFQEDEARAFVTSSVGLLRFEVQDDGTGQAKGAISSGAQSPTGISLGSATSAPTQVGADILVDPADEAEIVFDGVATNGLTRSRILEFEDNRAGAVDQGLRAFFPGEPLIQALLPDATVPGYVQAFNKRAGGDPPGGPFTGPPTFVLALVDTTSQFSRTAQLHFAEEKRLGWAPACTDPDPAAQPRTFYVPETDPPKAEPPILEGSVFTDFSTGCGSNIGRGSRFSLWLTARDTRSPSVIATAKFDTLATALDFYAASMTPAIQTSLASIVAAARAAYDANDKAGALAQLDTFVATIDASPAEFTPGPANVPGELIARAQSLQFMIPKT